MYAIQTPQIFHFCYTILHNTSLVDCLVVSVLSVDLDREENKKRATSGFGLKMMLGGSLCVSVTWKIQLSCRNIS